jgi:hypothetical protein
MTIESQAATSLVMEIYSLSILFLSCRGILQHNHGSHHYGNGISGIFQMFSVLKKLESLKLLDLVGLMTWRALFVSCDLIPDATFSHSSICLLYDLLSSIDGIVPDLFISEIFIRSFKKSQVKSSQQQQKRAMEGKGQQGEEDGSRKQKYLDLGSCSLEQIGLIWYSNKLSDYQKKLSVSVMASPMRVTRSRSHSVPTSHLSSSPPSRPPSTIWQRFKSRKSISIDDVMDRIDLSDDFIDEILRLKSDPSGSVFALASGSSSSSNGLNMNMTAKEVRNSEERKLFEELEITQSNLDDKIQVWKRIKRPGIDKGLFPSPTHPTLFFISVLERLIISILAILSEQTLLVEDKLVTLKNIYCCAWAGSDRRGKQKLHPGLPLLSSKDEIPAPAAVRGTSDFQPFEFFINPTHPPLYYTLEIYGDYVLVEEEKPIHFDQLLFSIVLSADLIPRDGSNLWVTSNNITHSVFRKKETVDIFLSGQLHSSSGDFRETSGMGMMTPVTKNLERDSLVSEKESPSTPNSRRSWSQRFSSVFSRKSMNRESLESTTRSMTPPPLPTASAASAGQLRSPIDLLLEQSGDLPSFSDSDEDDSRSESTTATRSVCEVGDVAAIFESMKIDISNLEDQYHDQYHERSEEQDQERALNGMVDGLEDREISSSSPLDEIQTLSSLPPSHELKLNQLETENNLNLKVDVDLELNLPPLPMEPSQTVSPSESSSQISQLSLKLFQSLCGLESCQENHHLGIYCLTPCPTCGECYLDQEILSSWCGFLSERLSQYSSASSSSSERSQDLLELHQIPCHKCKHLWKPLLHVRTYQATQTATVVVTEGREQQDQSQSPVVNLEVSWQCEVPYLSPLAVRIISESLVREHGAIVSDADWLLQTDSILYWNLIWYTSRFNLPNGLFQNSPSGERNGEPTTQHHPLWRGAIALGWRESTIKAKIRNSILQSFCTFPSSTAPLPPLLSLKDLFPSITEKDCLAADEMMKDLTDHSIPTISNLVKNISSLSSILESFSGNKGRQIYLSYLILLFHYRPTSLAKIPDIPYGLSKVPHYHSCSTGSPHLTSRPSSSSVRRDPHMTKRLLNQFPQLFQRMTSKRSQLLTPISWLLQQDE